ncbi:MAG: hypothetical protein CLLPBCKN_007525 [Chroococcidiopsis cubana SAG 39.79]|uniref:Uncharacterized protein n=1 Tax=Chroococcidiopsis cubana SAG 39.79 TaxID=388085 RepID=A0AB37UTB3_9CYAN|nr:hypothetical protein [Chroococcidiopsis cubana]MDZ4878090.1 hypothetical protein [Chroococcidiopsis cubana SAG 39.79]PSB59693.1 hypothetical protein C7B79_28550 [Chroococcidiopsis cubana CCALA 043]RUT14633.1 hypothetical protein DSM107010_01790 [Chroococcidiopsis cubana SAG 39.79]
MKFTILGGLSVLLFSIANVPTLGVETAAAADRENSTAVRYQLRPFNLVYLAYQGYFRDQGIPGYSAFLAAYESGRVSAEELVQSAVKKNKLSPETASDRGYLRAVKSQIESLRKD